MPKSQQQPMRPPTPFERLADPEGRRRSAEPKCELTEEKALELSKKLEGLKRGDLVRVTYYDTYGYRSRTGILDEALPAFKLLKLKDIAIDFDDIQDIELRGRA